MPLVVLQYWWGADTLFELQENRLKRSCCPDNLLSCMSSIMVNEPNGKEFNYLQVLIRLFATSNLVRPCDELFATRSQVVILERLMLKAGSAGGGRKRGIS